MAGGDGGSTRFSCLATVRYAVATVRFTVRYAVPTLLTLFAVVVVLMVMSVVFRPEDICLSVDRGYIEADWLLLATEDPYLNSTIELRPGVGTGADFGGGVEHTSHHQPERSHMSPAASPAESQPTAEVTLKVILSAYNPSGRTDFNFTKGTIRLLDIPNPPSFTGMVEIVKLDLGRFFVPRQTSRSLTRWLATNDTRELSQALRRQGGGTSSVRVMVQVKATITSRTPVPRSRSVSRYCWPVIVGSVDSDTLTNADDVTCKTREEIQYTVEPVPLAPAPAPGPAGPAGYLVVG